MEEKIVIIGAGEIGQAIAKLFSKKGVEIELWDKDESKNPEQKPLAEIVPAADFLFLCVPSWVLRAALKSFSGFLKKETVIVSLAKGIEAGTLKTVPEMIGELAPRHQFALLAGPMLAEELIDGKGGRGVAAVESSSLFEKVKSLFQGTDLILEWSADVRGVALASVVKNIYAVGLGIADCLGWGGNAKGWLFSRAFREMVEIVSLLGGQPATVLGTAGLGDLTATGFSPYSRNRQTGDELVRTGKCLVPGEGIVSLPSVLALLGEQKNKFPLLNVLAKVCLDGENAKKVFKDLFKKVEIDSNKNDKI